MEQLTAFEDARLASDNQADAQLSLYADVKKVQEGLSIEGNSAGLGFVVYKDTKEEAILNVQGFISAADLPPWDHRKPSVTHRAH